MDHWSDGRDYVYWPCMQYYGSPTDKGFTNEPYCFFRQQQLNPVYTGVAIVERLLSDEKIARSLSDLSKSAQWSPRSLNDLSMISTVAMVSERRGLSMISQWMLKEHSMISSISQRSLMLSPHKLPFVCTNWLCPSMSQCVFPPPLTPCLVASALCMYSRQCPNGPLLVLVSLMCC